MERSKLLAAAFLAGAFTLGATVGFAFDQTIARQDVAVADATSTFTGTYEDFAAELQLTSEQKAAVDSILDARHRVIDSLLAPVRPQMQAARDDARREIATRLSDEQRSRFDRYLVRQEQERWRPRPDSTR